MNNARTMDPPASIEANGFTMVNHPLPSEISNFDDENQVRDIYYKNITKLLKKIYPGAMHYHISDHKIRPDHQAPARIVHSDATE